MNKNNKVNHSNNDLLAKKTKEKFEKIVNQNSCYYFLAEEKKEKSENIVYHLFVLFPLDKDKASPNIYLEKGVSPRSSWNITCKIDYTIENPKPIKDYIQKHFEFEQSKDGEKQEIVIHTYVKGDIDSNSTTYKQTPVLLKDGHEFLPDYKTLKLNVQEGIACNCPYTQLVKRDILEISNGENLKKDIVRFYPRVIIPLKGFKLPTTEGWEKGLVDKELDMDIPEGRESFRSLIVLIKDNEAEENQINLLYDLEVNQTHIDDKDKINGKFETNVILLEDESDLNKINTNNINININVNGLRTQYGNLKDIPKEWKNGVLKGLISANGINNNPIQNGKPRSKSPKSNPPTSLFIDRL